MVLGRAAVLALLGAFIGVVPILVVAVRLLGILHVGVLVDGHHHLGHHLGDALEHLLLKLHIMQALVEVVDDVRAINIGDGISISEIPLGEVSEGLIGLQGDAAQIPSGFGT
jgi:hypothetical protein